MFNKKAILNNQRFLAAFFPKEKKCISPVVATSLLLVVAVVAVVGFQGWYQTFSSNLFVDAEQDSGNLDTSGIEGIIGETLYLKAGNNLSVESVRIDGNDCGINGTYSGTRGIDVSVCLSQTSSATPEIVMVTDDKVLSKSVYLDDKTTDSLSSVAPECYSAQVNTTGNWTGCQDMLIVDNTMLLQAGTSVPPNSGDGTYQIEHNGINYTFENSTYNIFTGQVTNMGRLFDNSNFNQNINYWDVSNVINMSSMFTYANSFNQPLDNWDVSSVTDMYAMFWNTPLNQSLNNWDVSNVENMMYMFRETVNFNQPLNNWDVSNVRDMYAMFLASNFNQDISSWNVGSVNDIGYMFSGAGNFNQNLSSWDVDQVTSCTEFNQSTPAWTLPKPNFTSC